MRNVLNQMKNLISDFSDSYFLSYGYFLCHFYDVRVINKNRIITEEGGLHILSWENAYICAIAQSDFHSTFYKFIWL